ncbi:hypothetical protein VQ03_18035 [Methylobacterium tarhaniae]|uniref:Carrier domain-containing protein n=1 Tax=Methylobacterium tarhaniae TaxID=1187852 RepID=A0A0J6SWJ9_9HYPH|nr:non-ribosomal peptide synthetase [Methylobacterium tarhaniae]KMO38079.1 hypothetical protein VQ03_18035 [Methylobacterium tarhaniae]
MRDSDRSSETLKSELARSLRVPVDAIDDHTNLIEIGLDSLCAMQWLNTFRKRGYRVSLRELFGRPTLAGWESLLKRTGAESRGTSPADLPSMLDGQPFPLSAAQHAYLVGRDASQSLGGVGCHLYQEFDGPRAGGRALEPAAVENAIRALRRRHPMLCTAFQSDGTQRYVGHPDGFHLRVEDLRGADPATTDRRLAELRREHGHRVLDVARGETLDFRLVLLPEGRHRLCVDLDLLVADAASFTLLFDELAALLDGRDLPARPRDYDFRSYLADLERRTADERRAARAFWDERLAALAPAPNLPLARDPAVSAPVRVTRRRHRIDDGEWRRIVTRARDAGFTPSTALVTCFGHVLGRWGGQERLLLNLTLFDRLSLHPAVDGMLADFTSILLLDLDVGPRRPFVDLVRANQEVFAQAHEHRHVSGVDVARDLRRAGSHPHGAPVVFTSNLGRPLFGHSTDGALGVPGWGISQTPQVWIDHLAYENDGSVHLQWDSNEALFPDGLVAAMFDAYVAVVRGLAAEDAVWTAPLPDAMPETQAATRRRVNATSAERPAGLLHEGVFARAAATPGETAIVHGDDALTCSELVDLARRLAATLRARGVAPGDRVAICMDKGVGQIVAALGILQAGGVFVPVAPQQPSERRAAIYCGAGVQIVLTCSTADDRDDEGGPACLTWQKACRAEPLAEPVAVPADRPAYVIYTSGSTGTPKGVVISHAAALNTCADVTRRNGVGPGDRVLGLSALHFDLSIYDIFGVLGAGGALVLVDEQQRRDPAAWCAAIRTHGVSVWNTVPALFDMLLTYAEGVGADAPASLRLVLLSGDWVGLDLAPRYRRFRPDGRFVAMGGATEAAIWSNAFVVDAIDPAWRSIPYGFPLANQAYRVVDPLGRDCPDRVPGELWIGGDGVALGYLGAPERTAEQFVEQDGARWYRTGDFGCYWPDGTLEFLGRRDRQVKVGGHRIELGEIDAALRGLPGIRGGLTLALGDRDKRLVAFAVAGDGADQDRLDLPAVLAATDASPLPSADAGDEGPVAGFLLEHLRREGIDFSTPISADDVLVRYGAQPAWRGLFERWLRWLAQRGALAAVAVDRFARGGIEAEMPSDPDLAMHHTLLRDILHGRATPLTILDHPRLSPEALQCDGPGRAAIARVAAIVRAMAARLGRPVRIAETGARSGMAAERLLASLDPDTVSYLGIETSPDMVGRARARLGGFPNAEVVTAARSRGRERWADLLWLNNHLHRLDDPGEGLRDVLGLAASGALIVVAERLRPTARALVGAELLEPRGLAERLHAVPFWRAACEARALSLLRADEGPDAVLLFLHDTAARGPDRAALLAGLARKLPAYMVPQHLHLLDSLPLTANGKIDHQALAGIDGGGRSCPTTAGEDPCGEAERAVAELWTRLLDVERPHRSSGFFEDGGDSLLATRFVGELAKLGFVAELHNLFARPRLSDFAASLRRSATGAAPEPLRADPAARHEPFPLTEVQQAYVVGRSPAFPLGGVGAHFFVEFEVIDLDLDRFARVWDRLIARHDALRTVVRDGCQVVLAEVPALAIVRHALDDLDGRQASDLRGRLSHQVLDPARWPVFDVQVAEDGSGRSRVYVGLDNLLLDGLSMQILLAELEQLYIDEAAPLPVLDIGFRDYVVGHGAAETEADRSYWSERLPGLPPAPQLSLRADPAQLRSPVFARRSARLNARDWAGLKGQARDLGMTPSALLLSCYAAVLGAGSARPDLTINLTLFDRAPVHPHIERVLGDFTSLLPLAWHPEATLEAGAQRLQRQLGEDLSHRRVSILRLLRELSARDRAFAVGLPVVFTSAIGFDTSRFLHHASWLRPCWGISQTPQVWLDHQVYESDGDLCFNWDFVEALFAPETIDGLFDAYVRLLRRLTVEPDAWTGPLDALVPPRAVPPPRAADPIAADPITAPAGPAAPAQVALVRGFFKEVVGRDVGPAQNFFEAGATSLQLVQLHGKLIGAGHDIAVTDLFAHPTPSALASQIGGAKGTDHAAADRSPALQRRRDRLHRRLGHRP